MKTLNPLEMEEIQAMICPLKQFNHEHGQSHYQVGERQCRRCHVYYKSIFPLSHCLQCGCCLGSSRYKKRKLKYIG